MFTMPTISTQPNYRPRYFDSSKSLVSRSLSLKPHTRKRSSAFSPEPKRCDSTTHAYAANITPPLDKSFADVRPMSSGKKLFNAFKANWKAGVSPQSVYAEDAVLSPRHAPIQELEKAEVRRRAAAARNAALAAPGRVQYLSYLQDRNLSPVVHETILETMWTRPLEEQIFQAHVFVVDEGEKGESWFF